MLDKPNPKDLIGGDKIPLHLWPPAATALGSIAMLNGALKYGRGNFRIIRVRVSVYIDAALRHISAWAEGEELDPDDGIPHLAAALANLAIIVDARAAGKLVDDRMPPGGYRTLVNDLTPQVAALKRRHRRNTPRHYTIMDKED